MRKHLEKWLSSKGAFNTLLKYGEDCASALVITAKGTPPPPRDGKAKVEIKFDELYKAIDEAKGAVDLIAEKKPGYHSVAGAQDKFPCIFEKGKIYLPEGASDYPCCKNSNHGKRH